MDQPAICDRLLAPVLRQSSDPLRGPDVSDPINKWARVSHFAVEPEPNRHAKPLGHSCIDRYPVTMQIFGTPRIYALRRRSIENPIGSFSLTLSGRCRNANADSNSEPGDNTISPPTPPRPTLRPANQTIHLPRRRIL